MRASELQVHKIPAYDGVIQEDALILILSGIFHRGTHKGQELYRQQGFPVWAVNSPPDLTMDQFSIELQKLVDKLLREGRRIFFDTHSKGVTDALNLADLSQILGLILACGQSKEGLIYNFLQLAKTPEALWSLLFSGLDANVMMSHPAVVRKLFLQYTNETDARELLKVIQGQREHRWLVLQLLKAISSTDFNRDFPPTRIIAGGRDKVASLADATHLAYSIISSPNTPAVMFQEYSRMGHGLNFENVPGQNQNYKTVAQDNINWMLAVMSGRPPDSKIAVPEPELLPESMQKVLVAASTALFCDLKL